MNLIPAEEQEKSLSLIPNDQEPSTKEGLVSPAYAEAFKKLAAYSTEGEDVAITGDVEADREAISAYDLAKKKIEKQAELYESMRDPSVQADYLATQMIGLNNLKANQQALEQRLVEKVVMPLDPVAKELAGDYKGFMERYMEDAQHQMEWRMYIDEYASKNEENIIEDVPDLLGHILMKETMEKWNIDGNGYQGVRAKVAYINKLPAEERRAARDLLVEQLLDYQFGWNNPSFVVNTLTSAVFNTEGEDVMESFIDVGEIPFLLADLASVGATVSARRAAKRLLLKGEKGATLARGNIKAEDYAELEKQFEREAREAANKVITSRKSEEEALIKQAEEAKVTYANERKAEAKAAITAQAGEKISRGEIKQLKEELRQLRTELNKTEIIPEEAVKQRGVPARKVKKDAQDLAEKKLADRREFLTDRITRIESILARDAEALSAKANLSRASEREMFPEEVLKDIADEQAKIDADLKQALVDKRKRELEEDTGLTLVDREARMSNAAVEELARLAARVGAGEALVEDAFRPISEAKIFTDPADQVTLVNAFNPEGTDYPNFTSKIRDRLSQQATDLSRTWQEIATSAPESIAEIANRKLAEFGFDRPVHTFTHYSVDSNNKLGVKLGDKEGRKFITEELATAEKDRLDPSGEWLELGGNKKDGYFLKGVIDLDEAGYPTKQLGNWTVNNIENIINTALVHMAHKAERVDQVAIQETNRIFKQDIVKNLSSYNLFKRGKIIQAFRNITRIGVDESRWLSFDEFAIEWQDLMKAPATEKLFMAYQSFKNLSDFAHMVNNNTVYRSELAKGYGTYAIEGIDNWAAREINGKPADPYSYINDKDLFTTHASVLRKDGKFQTLSPEKVGRKYIEELLETHKMVEVSVRSFGDLYGDIQIPTVHTFIPRDIPLAPLSQNQLPYRAGGRGGWNASHLVKVARETTHVDGTKVRLNDITLAAANSLKSARQYAVKLTDAFRILKEYKEELIDLATANTQLRALHLVDGAASFQTMDDVMEWGLQKGLVKEDKITIPEFQGVRDGEWVDMSHTGSAYAADATKDIYSAFQGTSFTKWRSGKKLPHVDGRMADILDPLEALNKHLNMTANMAGWSSFKARALDMMEKQYGQYFQKGSISHPMDVLTAAIDHKKVGADLAQQIENHQQWLTDLIGTRTRYQKDFSYKMERAVNAVFDKVPALENAGNWLHTWAVGKYTGGLDTSRSNIRRNLTTRLSKDPYVRAKSMVFNAKMGLGHVGAFIMQFMNVYNIMAMTGKEGVQAALTGLPLRIAMNMTDDAEGLKVLAKWFGKKELGFDSPEDFISAAREFRYSGMGHMDRSMAYIDGMSGAQSPTSFFEHVLELGRFFFNEGERGSRLTATGAARREWKTNKYGVNPNNLPVTSREAKDYINNRTHLLMGGFSKADLQLALRAREGGALKDNIVALATQFWSYPMRMMGMVAGRQLRKNERIRFVVAQFLAFGAAGIPVLDYFAKELDDKYGGDVHPAVSKLFLNGFIDGALYAALGVDAATAQRGGIGHFSSELVDAIMNKEFAFVITGAVGQSSAGVLGALHDAMVGFSATEGDFSDRLTEGTLNAFVETISSLNNFNKLRAGFTTGVILDKSSKKSFEVTKSESVANLLGFPFNGYQIISRDYSNEDSRRESIKNGTEYLMKQYKDYFDAVEDGDADEAEQKMININLFTQSVDRDRANTMLDAVYNDEYNKSRVARIFEKQLEYHVQGSEQSKMSGVFKRLRYLAEQREQARIKKLQEQDRR